MKQRRIHSPEGWKPCISACPPFCLFQPRQLLQSSGSLPQEQSESSSNRSLSSNENLSPSYSHSNIKSMMFGGTSENQQGWTRHFFSLWVDDFPQQTARHSGLLSGTVPNIFHWSTILPYLNIKQMLILFQFLLDPGTNIWGQGWNNDLFNVQLFTFTVQ